MADDTTFPPFPFPTSTEPPPMPKEKKARKARKTKEAKATNGRRRRKGRPRKHAASPETGFASRHISMAETAHDDLVTVSVEDIKFINGILQSLQALPHKQRERIVTALTKMVPLWHT